MGAWQSDKLKRQQSADFLTDYLTNKYSVATETAAYKSFVLNINGEWGFGKTYLLQNWKEDLLAKKYPVVYFDAWSNDFSEQPLVAFISELNSQLRPLLQSSRPAKTALEKMTAGAKQIVKLSTPALLALLAKHLTGLSVQQLMGNARDADEEPAESAESKSISEGVSTVVSKAAEHALKDHMDKKRSINDFKSSLARLMQCMTGPGINLKLPLFVLIDELDRCRPNYALELLENVKHLFRVSGVYFVVATDARQLSHSVNALYGSHFDSQRYLRRFFDQEYVLPAPDNQQFAAHLFQQNPVGIERFFVLLDDDFYPAETAHIEAFALMSSYFRLSLRDQEQCMTVLIAVTLTYHGPALHLVYLLFLIMLRQRSALHFDRYVDGLRDVDQLFKEADLVAKSTTFRTHENVQQQRRNLTATVSHLVKAYEDYVKTPVKRIAEDDQREHVRARLAKALVHQFLRHETDNDLATYVALVQRAGHLA